MSWSIHSPSKFHSLAKTLRELNDDLFFLCAPEKRQRLERSAMSAIIFAADELELKRRALIDASKLEEEDARTQEFDQTGAPKLSEWYVVLAQVARTLDKVRGTGRNADSRPAFLSINEFIIPDYDAAEQTHALAYESRQKRIRLIEWKSFLVDGVPSSTLKDNIHELLRIFMLDQRPADFRMLPVIGYVKDDRFSRYGIVYRLPTHMGEYNPNLASVPTPREFSYRHPHTLASFLDAPILELGLRFQLAKQLANSLHLLHTAGYTHRNLRPESIVFFATESRNRGGPSSYRVSLTTPYLVNYGLVKPNRSGTQSMYIHPRQYGAPTQRHLPMFDVYALGLVLLEIGLWQPLATIWRTGYTPREFRDIVLTEVLRDVGGTCGATYRDVVKECLTMETENPKECAKALCWRIAGKLDKLQA